MNDPVVQEVRKQRLKHTLKFGGNLAAICADLRSVQEVSGHTVVRLTPKGTGLRRKVATSDK